MFIPATFLLPQFFQMIPYSISIACSAFIGAYISSPRHQNA
jgi:hypothetical protein